MTCLGHTTYCLNPGQDRPIRNLCIPYSFSQSLHGPRPAFYGPPCVASLEGEFYNVVRQGRGVPAVPLVLIGIEP